MLEFAARDTAAGALSGVLPTFLLLLLAATSAGAQDEIFSDDFETGTVDAWSEAVGLAEAPPCVSGAAIPGEILGDLGPAPGGAAQEVACLTLRNDRAFLRQGETAFSGVPIPQALGLLDGQLDRLVVVGPGNRRLPAQFDVLSRWGGALTEDVLPIRWLGVSTQALVQAQGETTVALRLMDAAPPAPTDGFAATLTPSGGGFVVDTGVATFSLDPSTPELVSSISIAPMDDGATREMIYTSSPGAGPRLVFDPGGGPLILGTENPGSVGVDAGGFEIVEDGPVKVVVASRGHFQAAGGASLCLAIQPGYERFGYTVVMTFHRGRRDVDVRFHVRNECSDADGNPFIDDGIEVDEASWRWPLATHFTGTRTVYHGGDGVIAASSAGFSGDTVVEQRKGAGDPWQRRARVLRDGVPLETGEAFEKPLVALADGTFLAALQMPFMRYREPQALAVVGATLAARPISEPLVVGEAKAVWSQHRLTLLPRAMAGGSVESWLETLRDTGGAALERGLLLHTDLEAWNAAGLYPTVGEEDTVSPIETYYLETLEFIHQENVRPGGQWDRHQTYGSQLWPDVQFDQYNTSPTPQQNAVASNYWNPLGAELWEFIHGGDPKWVWDFALAQSWHQAFAVFLNIGHYEHGSRNGVTVAGTGTGEGHWNRNGDLSSDDYNYNMGQQLAYALRPDVTLRHRFDQVGFMLLGRYDVPQAQQASRTPFFNEVDLSRNSLQHFEHLANCAEFSPGQRGLDCHDRLMAIVSELVDDNASAGVFCGGDLPNFAVPCSTPQQFMMNAHFYHLFDRLYRNYGNLGPDLRDALVGAPLAFYDWALPKQGDGVSIDIAQAWPNGMDCTLSPDGETLLSCAGWTGGDPTFFQNYPHTVALLLIAQGHDPSIGLCQVSKSALDQLAAARAIDGYLSEGAGWFKGSAQVMQGLIFGVGGYEVCADP